MKLIDKTGERFGRLIVLGKLREPRMWLCLCDCGNKVKANGSNLANGSTRSCGCLAREWAKQLGGSKKFIPIRAEKITKHGHRRSGCSSAEYKTWLGMKSRCYRETDKSFSGWGARGIVVCDRWRNDFSAFLADMGEKPTPKHTIDRIDPNGNYEPENCRWATQQEQGAEHRRGIVPVTVGGIQFKSIAEACRHFGILPTTVNERIRSGVSIDNAFSKERLKPRRTRESYLPISARTRT